MRRWAKQLLMLVAVAAGIGFLSWQMNNERLSVTLKSHSYAVSVMRTDDELLRGLSGTKELADGHAMLFVFPFKNNWKIWMKDMNYPIDIVWLDENRNILYLVKNAQPSSYPKKFGPDKHSHYVIELPSGTIDKTGITVGDSAGLPSGI